ncbi:MAG: CatB-related O-acetyltransferase [Clostridia bacterium]|nr:CatB-related O-acetyltransferase [Clostridia bacterium]
MRVSFFISKLFKKLHLPAIKNSTIDKKSKICPGAHLVNTNVDKYSYIGNFSTVINCNIGSFCSIADNCLIGSMAHPTDWVSSSPVMYAGKNCLKTNFSKKVFVESQKSSVGNDVWIGDGVKIKAGITIGDGAIIGMGSVVTHDVPPYEIWAGNPAKLIRKRFDDETIERLLKSKWWDLSYGELLELGDCFDNVKMFLDKIDERKSREA